MVTADVSGFTPRKARTPLWTLREAAILRTVLYSSVFEYPLRIDELRRSLLQSAQTNADILRTYSQSARLQRSIELRDGLFFPRGCARWILQRRRREQRSLAFLRRHHAILRLIAALPFVRLVALSGSLAVLNGDRRADLDLFVVTSARRAWMTTFAIVALMKLLRRRRIVCLNYVMTDDALAIEQTDLFTANQIIHLRPIAGAPVYQRFLDANPFVRRFYPEFDPSDVDAPMTAEPGALAGALKRMAEWLLNAVAWFAEPAVRRVYGGFLRWRSTSWASPDQVRLSAVCLKLHTHSHRREVLDRFDALCRREFDRWRDPDLFPEEELTVS